MSANAEGKSRFLLGGALLSILPLVAGVVLTGIALGAAVKRIPNDLMRVRTNLETLKLPDPAPEGVVFGNSVGMNGLNARQLSDEIDAGPVVYNLCSTGQSLPESYLYFQELPGTVRFVVQIIYPTALENEQQLRENIYNAFYLYGYRPRQETIESFARVMDRSTVDMMNRPALWHAVHSRWILRQWPDTTIRRMSRTDLNLERAYFDRYYPSPYTEKLEQGKINRSLRRWMNPRAHEELVFADSTIGILESMARDLKREGRTLYVVMAPMHPALREHVGEKFLLDLSEFSANHGLGDNVQIINATDLLRESQFIDHAHPTPEGAKILGSLIAANID